MAHTYPGHSLPTRTSGAQRDLKEPCGLSLNPKGHSLNHCHCQDQSSQGDEDRGLSSLAGALCPMWSPQAFRANIRPAHVKKLDALICSLLSLQQKPLKPNCKTWLLGKRTRREKSQRRKNAAGGGKQEMQRKGQARKWLEKRDSSTHARLQLPVNLSSWQWLTIKMEHKCWSNKILMSYETAFEIWKGWHFSADSRTLEKYLVEKHSNSKDQQKIVQGL